MKSFLEEEGLKGLVDLERWRESSTENDRILGRQVEFLRVGLWRPGPRAQPSKPVGGSGT